MSPIPLGILAASGVGAASGLAYELLETVRLDSTAASIELTSLDSKYSSDYLHLELRVTARSSTSGSNAQDLYIQFNNSTSGYRYITVAGEGTSELGEYNTGRDSARVRQMLPKASATGDAYGSAVMLIPNAFSTLMQKKIQYIGGTHLVDQKRISFGEATSINDSSSKIDKITVSNLNNLLSGTVVKLYGWRAA
jgi:hypothetical protein